MEVDDSSDEEELIFRKGHSNSGEVQPSFAWENKYQQSWKNLFSNNDDLRSVQEIHEERLIKKRKIEYSDDQTQVVLRGIKRHVFLVLDYSRTMCDTDLKPSRFKTTFDLTVQFITNFFEENPISQLGIILTKNSIAEKITELSGNVSHHIETLNRKSKLQISGDPSLQNALEIAHDSLVYVPKFGSREVIMIVSSLTSCDPGDISQNLKKCKENSIQISTIHLSGEMFVCKNLAEKTSAKFLVPIDKNHFKQLYFSFLKPMPLPLEDTESENDKNLEKKEKKSKNGPSLVRMGFPAQKIENDPSFCLCHKKLTYQGYFCPQCHSKYCNLPTDCEICSLTLVSSPHLARSYHHLFPIPVFQEQMVLEINLPSDSVTVSKNSDVTCYSCHGLPSTNNLILVCPNCNSYFCLECDLFIHKNLHNCPGCEMLDRRKNSMIIC